ncbi:hypothetical protein [Oryza sativa Japonica Group]|uniref:Uncharacterized protein n=1 Tax=Oryza sativa subsp. japonica TaxID=39947 RepID=Q5ZDH8_ORYSJ|nr:hypothetical protein [Oryza sativa Japonica Group]
MDEAQCTAAVVAAVVMQQGAAAWRERGGRLPCGDGDDVYGGCVAVARAATVAAVVEIVGVGVGGSKWRRGRSLPVRCTARRPDGLGRLAGVEATVVRW